MWEVGILLDESIVGSCLGFCGITPLIKIFMGDSLSLGGSLAAITDHC